MTVTESLREEHCGMTRLLQALERQINILDQGKAPDYDIIIGVADYFFSYSERCHHLKEDLIVSKLRVSHRNVIYMGRFIVEHQDIRERAMRFWKAASYIRLGAYISSSEIIAAARDFITSKYRHMREEEESLFPTAESFLTAAEWAHIEDCLDLDVHARPQSQTVQMYRRLSDHLLARDYKDGGGSSPLG